MKYAILLLFLVTLVIAQPQGYPQPQIYQPQPQGYQTPVYGQIGCCRSNYPGNSNFFQLEGFIVGRQKGLEGIFRALFL